MEQQTVIILVQSIAIAILIFKKSYLQKKGANQADKQDIADITIKIEEVKKSFINEHELLKKNLDLIKSAQLRNSNDERTAILDFFKIHTQWIEGSINFIQINRFNRENILELKAANAKIENLKSECNIALHYLSLHTDDTEIIKLSSNLMIDSFDISHWVTSKLSELQLVLAEQKLHYDLFIKEHNSHPTGEFTQHLAIKEKENKMEALELAKEIISELSIKYDPLLRKKYEFSQYVKNHFRKNNF